MVVNLLSRGVDVKLPYGIKDQLTLDRVPFADHDLEISFQQALESLAMPRLIACHLMNGIVDRVKV